MSHAIIFGCSCFYHSNSLVAAIITTSINQCCIPIHIRKSRLYKSPRCSCITSTAGSYKEAALPNITGYITDACCYDVYGSNVEGYANGAFYSSGFGIYQYESNGSSLVHFSNLHFSANSSNSIYGSANTVQPLALFCQYLIKY